MTVRIDPGLGAPGVAPDPADLGGGEPPLARAGPADTRPFLVEGERVAVAGTERAGAASLWVDGRRVAGDLATDAGMGANVVVGPALLRRELVGPRGTVLETILALPALSLVALQWAPPRGAPGLGVALTLLPGADGVRYHAAGGGVRAVAGADAAPVELRAHPAPEAWTVGEAEGGGIRVHAAFPATGRVTLLLTAGEERARERAAAAAPHLAAHAMRAAADADPERAETLALRTGVSGTDHGVAWATARVRTALLRSGAAEPGDVFWSGMGAVATGADAPALRAAALLDAAGDAEAHLGVGEGVPTPALATLLAARVTLLTGDPDAAAARLGRLGSDGVDALRRRARPWTWDWWCLALETLADALRHAAPEAALAALRRSARRPPGVGGRALPVTGAPPLPGSAPWLRGVLRGGGGLPPSAAGADRGRLGPWATLAAGATDDGYAAWRARLAGGLDRGPGGRGTWDGPGDSGGGGAPGAGIVLCTAAYGLLGVEPDAPSGRLRLAPALPSHVRAFAASGLRVGDARLSLGYERAGRTHRISLEAARGRVPPMVVLEPLLPCPGVAGVRVDGGAADVELRAEGPRTRLRVQLPVDGRRVVEADEA